jgi:serine/threonine-protein kinase HipA
VSTRRIDVRIGGDDGRGGANGTTPRPAVPVGELIYEVSGIRETAVFTYHQSWLKHPNRFPLSPDMPLRDGPMFRTKAGNASALPLPVADGAPDSWGRAIIKMGFKGEGRGRAPNDLDFLLESDDFLRSGALRYFDGPGEAGKALAAPRTAEKGGVVSVPRLYELDDVIKASRAFEADPEGYRAERGKFIGGDLIANLGSLGGARPKVNARDDRGHLWIAKLAKQDDTYALARTELMALRLAARVGIRSSETKILTTEAQRFPVALVKRFDRLDGGARVPFISAQTFMGLEGSEPGNYVDLAHRMMTFCANPKEQMADLHRRLMYTVLIQNTDDHLRNIGFIAAPGGKWQLSPAFDVNPVPEDGTTLKTAISDIHGNELSIEAVIEVAPYFDLTEDDAARAAQKMAATIRDEWRGIGASLGMSRTDYRAIAPAMEGPQIAAALRLGLPATPLPKTGPQSLGVAFAEILDSTAEVDLGRQQVLKEAGLIPSKSSAADASSVVKSMIADQAMIHFCEMPKADRQRLLDALGLPTELDPDVKARPARVAGASAPGMVRQVPVESSAVEVRSDVVDENEQNMEHDAQSLPRRSGRGSSFSP